MPVERQCGPHPQKVLGCKEKWMYRQIIILRKPTGIVGMEGRDSEPRVWTQKGFLEDMTPSWDLKDE